MSGAVARVETSLDPLVWAAAADIAYQPIISMRSLRALGFEALCRLPAESPYASAHALLDAAADAGTLRDAERSLLGNAIVKFARFAGASEARLFCNIDNRVFDDAEVRPETIIDIARASGLQPANICIELSERRPPESVEALARLVDVFLKHNVRIAIDDFGQGFSGLDTLLRVNPHYVKIDRAFIDGLARSPRQQAIVSKVAGLAHSLGLIVVAEGIETESDFRAARDLGCDLGQGYLIARPDVSLPQLRMSYDRVLAGDRREASIPRQVAELVSDVQPLQLDDLMADVVARFKSVGAPDFIPVVDRHRYVHGAVYQDDLRDYLFGEYGRALLANKGVDQSVARFVRRCPLSDAAASTETMVESYVVAGSNKGLVLTLDGLYFGVLPNHALLRLAAESEIASARDQNPLTSLPGNNSISRHLTEVLASSHDSTLVFFDFDNFKAFNDNYGFAVGDRALLMFADLLMTFRHEQSAFIGHIGGDDFFLSLPQDLETSVALVRDLADRFRADVESLYLHDDRARGGLWGKDRFGETRFFPLLRVSAAILPLPASRNHLTADETVAALSAGKSAAKKARNGLATVELPPTEVARNLSRLSVLAEHPVEDGVDRFEMVAEVEQRVELARG